MKEKLISPEDIRCLHPIFRGKYGDKLIKFGVKLTALDVANAVYDGSKHLTGHEFCTDLLDKMQVKRIVKNAEILESFKNKPFITVSNHPYGHIDGIALIETVASRVDHYKVMVNYILGLIDTMSENFIAVSPYKSEQPDSKSLNGIKECIAHLKKGYPLGFFPAGSNSRLKFVNGILRIYDRAWQQSVIKLIQKAKVPVIPIHFSGRNSLSFYLTRIIFGWRVQPVRLCHELKNKKNHTMIISIGNPIMPEEIAQHPDADQLGNFLRDKTYALAKNK